MANYGEKPSFTNETNDNSQARTHGTNNWSKTGKICSREYRYFQDFFFGVTVKLFYIGSCSINHQTNLYDTNTCRGSSYDSELNITSLQSIRKLEDRSSFLKLHTLYYLFTTADIQGKGK